MTGQKTFIDWFKFRTQSHPLEVFEALKSCFIAGLDCLVLCPEEGGKDGWKTRRQLRFADERIGAIDYGGDSQRGWVRVDISGAGCKWLIPEQAYKLIELLKDADIRRLDIALDVFDGSVSREVALDQHASGGFDRGGRRPKVAEFNGHGEGFTVYVGRRQSSRFVRIYGKGHEILKDCKAADLAIIRNHPMAQWTWDCGNKSTIDNYVRLEAEFKAVDAFIVPWTALIDRDTYFAGIGPYFQAMVEVAPVRLQSMPAFLAPQLTMHSVLEHCRIAYGKALKTRLMQVGDTVENRLILLNELVSDQPSERLVSLGILSIPE